MLRPDPIPELKEAAAAALVRRIERWSSASDAAAMLGVDRARIVDIRRGRLARFSLETLLRLVVRAGARVELHVLDPTFRRSDRAALIDETHSVSERQRPIIGATMPDRNVSSMRRQRREQSSGAQRAR